MIGDLPKATNPKTGNTGEGTGYTGTLGPHKIGKSGEGTGDTGSCGPNPHTVVILSSAFVQRRLESHQDRRAPPQVHLMRMEVTRPARIH